MYLTSEEERIYNGEYGEALQKAIQVIVKVGEALGASKLIEINHAHVSGISYNNIGEAGLRFIEDLYRSGARFMVETTINPVGTDMDDPYVVPGVTPEFVSKQARIIKYLSAMGAKPVMTCTPYYVDNIKPGWHMAWGESSAVAYANSVIGAWTNREGGPLALLAGIMGKTYYAGVHIPENRVPRTKIVIEKYVGDQAYAGIIGKLIAESTTEKPPLVLGLDKATNEELKTMCAAAGAAGNLELCVIPGLTNVPTREELEEKIVIEAREVEEELDKYKPSSSVDLIFLGCPHSSLNELAILLNHFKNIGGKARIPFWVALSRKIYEEAIREGIAQALMERNVRLLRDTCIVVSPGWRETGYSIATNSFKTAFYLKRIHGIEAYISPLKDLVKLAVEGRP